MAVGFMRNSFPQALCAFGKEYLVNPTAVLPYIHYVLVYEFSGREIFHIMALGQWEIIHIAGNNIY